jgi:hypothetical protein
MGSSQQSLLLLQERCIALTGPPVRLKLHRLRWYRFGALSHVVTGFVLGMKALKLAIDTVYVPSTFLP